MRLLSLVLVLLAVLAVPALAAQGPDRTQKAAARKVIRHCASGRSLQHDPTAALLLARRTLPADISQYSDCEQRIARALSTRHYARPPGRDRVASVLADCRDGSLDRRFPRTTLQRARRHAPAAGEDCVTLVERELRRQEPTRQAVP